jgi:hypothetical protein
MPAIRKRIGDHPVLAFFVGAYAITWSVWIPVPTVIDRGVIAYDATASDGHGSGTVQRDILDPEERWGETVDRLHNNEETVYTVVLEAGGKLPQRDIVEGTELSKATVSRTLDTLESKDLVERKRKGMGNVVVLT